MNAEECNVFKRPRLNSNTNFIPRKIKQLRPTPPELPATPYMRFSKTNMDKLSECYPNSKLWNLGAVMGQLWRELPEKEKKVYFDSYKMDKAEYDKKIKAFYSSDIGNNDTTATSEIGQTATEPISLVENEESIIDTAEADEEDFEDQWYADIKIAHARFVRNNLLMNNIFSDSRVTNHNESIEFGKFERMAKSANTLEVYLKKRIEEIENIERNHEQRLKTINESDVNFDKQLKEIMVLSKLIKVCGPPTPLKTD